ncbi:MAG: hypothetical protein IKW28_11500, partial [Lachnospiraceae bacterium]|nr:hypothetical protein [Lachnospiraceae bacterium]
MKTRRMILAFVLSIACALTSIPALPASVAYATETTGDVSGNVSGNVSNNGTASGDNTVSDDTTVSGDSTVSGDGTVSGGSTVSNNNGEQGTEQPAEPEKYTTETPFVFPSVVGASAKLEAEKSNLINVANSQDQGNNQTYPVAVADKGWASGGKIVNALNKDDKMEIPYQAAEAGIYKVVVHYRSGSSSNKLVWAETNGKIQQGEVSAGASNSNEDKQAEFTITITEAGSGTWVFTGPESKSPQLDYFEITFQSRDEYGAQNPFIFPNEVNKTVTLEAEKGILTDVSNNKDGNGQWPLEVKADTWASGGKFVNSLNKDDKLEIHYQAAVAGTYKVVAKYRSGSPNNKLVWSDTEGNIADGEQVAGSPTNETSVDKTVEFNIQIDKAGSGIWTFTGPENNSPQLDRLDITLTSEKPLFTDFVGDEAAVNNSAGEPLPWGPTPDAN